LPKIKPRLDTGPRKPSWLRQWTGQLFQPSGNRKTDGCAGDCVTSFQRSKQLENGPVYACRGV